MKNHRKITSKFACAARASAAIGCETEEAALVATLLVLGGVTPFSCFTWEMVMMVMTMMMMKTMKMMMMKMTALKSPLALLL